MKIETGEWSDDQKDIELQESERLRIFHGEPMDILPLLKSGSVDLCVGAVLPTPKDYQKEIGRILAEEPPLDKKEPILLDPSMGDGKLAVETLQKGRRYIGIEPDKQRWEQACQRLRDYEKPKPKKGATFAMLFGPPKSS